MGVWQDL
jgi:hypothetical protein